MAPVADGGPYSGLRQAASALSAETREDLEPFIHIAKHLKRLHKIASTTDGLNDSSKRLLDLLLQCAASLCERSVRTHVRGSRQCMQDLEQELQGAHSILSRMHVRPSAAKRLLTVLSRKGPEPAPTDQEVEGVCNTLRTWLLAQCSEHLQSRQQRLKTCLDVIRATSFLTGHSANTLRTPQQRERAVEGGLAAAPWELAALTSALTQEPRSEVKASVIGCIAGNVSDSAVNQRAFALAIPQLVVLLEDGAPAELQAAAARALACLAFGSPNNQRSITQAGAAPRLSALVHSAKPQEVTEQAMEALQYLQHS